MYKRQLYEHYDVPIIMHAADMYPFTGGCQYPGKCLNYLNEYLYTRLMFYDSTLRLEERRVGLNKLYLLSNKSQVDLKSATYRV